jgi:hypothetical protein
MVPKTLAQAIKRWPAADLGELLALIAAEIHARAENKADYERGKGKRVAGRSAQRKESGHA